ncbi:hypothetical protein YC2023_116693 [Brassica napus]
MRLLFGGTCWWSAVTAPVRVLLLSTLKLLGFIVYHITNKSINDGFRWHGSSLKRSLLKLLFIIVYHQREHQ